jgi:ABC-type uncharacterized transport system involved in gliding motility auxiliary subunit
MWPLERFMQTFTITQPREASPQPPAIRRPNQRIAGRILLLMLGFFVAGMAVSALWFYHNPGATSMGSHSGTQPTEALAENTKTVLEGLNSPVEIRFYSLLDPAGVPESVRAYARRVEHLLAEYQRQANGKIKVTRFSSPSRSSASAAMADGIKPFSMDSGERGYLGMAVVQGSQKEVLASLAPEWEQALEFDLTRAIARTAEVNSSASAPVHKTDPAVLDSLKKSIPNLDAVSVEEGAQLLREAALAEFRQASKEMETKIQAAEQQFLNAQSSQSASDQQKALEQLQQLQAEQTDKLKQIAADAKAQLQAFQQQKAANH